MAKSINQGGSVFADINITPLTDVFLVLLIIFMVTTAVTIESAAHVDLPKAESAASGKPKGVLVTYTADHQIFVEQKRVTLAGLPPVLRSALGRSPDKLVVFSGDPQVLLGEMVHILDIAKSAGADAIAIAVAKSPPAGASRGASGTM